MRSRSSLAITVVVGALSLVHLTNSTSVDAAGKVDVAPLVATIRKVGPKGAGHKEAAAAWKALAKADANDLPQILAGMDGADLLPTNWLRASVDAIAERTIRSGGQLPNKQLLDFLLDTKHAPRARRTAFELIVRVDPKAKTDLVPKFLNDSSLEMRRDAVADAMDKLAERAKSATAEELNQAYRSLLTSARDLDQIKAIHAKLKSMDQVVDLPTHFGFIQNWKIIGPFDNSKMGGFETAYPPETEIRLDGKYAGKMGDVAWVDSNSTDEFGVVNLTKVLDKHKGAIAYGVTKFVAAKAQDVEIRIGSSNANKVWLNGEFLTANEVYHLGQEIDQYIAKGRLKEGENTILVKICQNEQTEEWAQRWEFQLRVCDEVGTAVLSADQAKR